MAQHSGFFNALITEGEYDRKYNANDYSENLAVVISNGVLRSIADDLKVTAEGMVSTVAAGRAWVNGHWFYNDAPHSFNAVAAPIGGKRYDRVMLRMDKNIATRNVELVYVQGEVSNNPVKPAPTRTDMVYDLVLADIFVDTNATSVVVTDTRADNEICGWLYSTSGDNSFFASLDNSFMEWFAGVRDTLASVTLFKRYTWQQTLANPTSTVAFDIPQYDEENCFIEVYVNGILDHRHTVSSNIITFVGSLVAGTVVTVNAYKSIDGTGIMDVADEITELQNQYATLAGVSKYTYKCTGLNDNIAISQIAQAILSGSYVASDVSQAAATFLQALGGNTFLAALPEDAQITIDVVGVCGATTPFAGDGSASSRYKWFSLGQNEGLTRKLIFDFGKCHKIDITCAANTNNIIFYGTDLHLKNVHAVALSSAAACNISMCVGASEWGDQEFEACRFKIVTTGKAIIAHHGNFTDCVLHVKSGTDNGYCIDAKSNGYVRLLGGTYFAYTGTTSKVSAVINVESTETNAVVLAHGINCPTVQQSGYYQNYIARTNIGMTIIMGVISSLTFNGNASYRQVSGHVNKTKH